MKKTLFTFLFTIATVAALRADEKSMEILRRMGAAFGGYTSYRVEFTATLPGEFERLPGKLIVSGGKYYLDVSDSEVFFDGKDGYTYSETNAEVIVETPAADDNRLFANPSRIFQLYERDFEAVYKGAVQVNGKNTAHIDLTPRSAEAGYSHIALYTDAEDRPVRLVYRLDEYGKELVLDVLRIAPNIEVSPETFRFDTKKHPGVEIIDFR